MEQFYLREYDDALTAIWVCEPADLGDDPLSDDNGIWKLLYEAIGKRLIQKILQSSPMPHTRSGGVAWQTSIEFVRSIKHSGIHGDLYDLVLTCYVKHDKHDIADAQTTE